MVIRIKEPVTKGKVLQAFSEISARSQQKNLKRHFGKLKRGIDGLEYQKSIRMA